jgi:hypothetical protein
MKKSTLFVLVSLVSAASGPALADGCAKERPLSPAEKAVVEGWSAALDRLLPRPPAGWTVFEAQRVSSASGTVCEGPGYTPPFQAGVKATYLPEEAPEIARRKADEARTAQGAKIQALTKELQAAVQRGDTVRMQELSQQMVALSRSPELTAPPPAGTSARRAVVRLEVNFTSYELCGAAKPAALPGAAFAWRWAGVNCMEGVPSDGLAAGFGDFRPKTNFQDRLSGYGAGFTFDAASRPPTKAHTAFAEIHGDAAAVDALVKGLDAAGLRALTAK